MEKSTEIYLDLHKYELLGWESEKSSLLIAAMIEGIKLGYKFPAVNIIHKENHTYQLFGFEGGHHRSVAHLITNTSLKCNLFKKANASFYIGQIPIRNITLTGLLGSDIPYIKNSLSQLPENVAKKFCNDNEIGFKEYYLDWKKKFG